MPRSGGDYLFLSRVVHPLAGFIVNGIISLVFIAGLGNVALTVPQFGLPAMFESLAFITGRYGAEEILSLAIVDERRIILPQVLERKGDVVQRGGLAGPVPDRATQRE
jgi:amino acid transporter